MVKRKVHLFGLNYLTLCGRDRLKTSPTTPSLDMAKSFKDVTCKSCMKSWEYKQYLLGKLVEKPIKKS